MIRDSLTYREWGDNFTILHKDLVGLDNKAVLIINTHSVSYFNLNIKDLGNYYDLLTL